AVVRHRPGAGGVSGVSGRRRRDGPPLPRGPAGEECACAAGAGRDLQCRRPASRGPQRRALRPCPAPPARLPPAVGDGVERKTGAPRRIARRAPDLSRRFRRTRHQRPARLLPADASGAAGRSGRVHHRRPHLRESI
uniref:Transcriptional regulator, HxlR family n=1 Tax=Parastrongyloides trichosuri TaxID=131310 RepID=A0A0N4ZZB1_PARTI